MPAYLYVSNRFTLEQQASFARVLEGTPYTLITAENFTPAHLQDLAIVVDPPKTLVPAIIKLPHYQLKLVQVISTGIDYLPLRQLDADQVMVANGSGLQMVSVAEHALGAILSFTRGLARSYVQGDEVRWHVPNQPVMNLNLAHVLILGTGTIGQYLGQLLAGFGTTVDGINTSGHAVAPFAQTFALKELPNVVGDYDVVVNLLPGTTATENILNGQLFSAMKNTGAVVNVGRGSALVEKDLVAAIAAGELAAAFLDVYETEPLPADSPLRQEKNIYLTPHIAGTSLDLSTRFFNLALKNVESFITTGAPAENLIDFSRGY